MNNLPNHLPKRQSSRISQNNFAAMQGMPDNPITQVMGLVDLIFHIEEKCHQVEVRRRYDDNGKKIVENAYRLYELGMIDKEQLKALIDLMP